MFKLVRRRLTLLFTGVSLLIMVISSVIYAFFSYRMMKDSSMLNFENDMASFSSDLERDSVISYDKLMDLRKNRGYIFRIYDNSEPLRITDETSTDEQKDLFAKAEKLCGEVYISYNSIYTEHTEFTGRIDGEEYLISHILIPRNDTKTEIFALSPLKEMKQDFLELCIKLGAVILAAAVALWLFSYWFTKKLLAPIKESRQRETEFIAAASHEIRNPVNNIKAAVDSIEKADDPHRTELISIARKECGRLARLTGDLLTLARSDSKTFTANFGTAELDTIALDCFEAAMPKACGKGIRFDIDLPDDTLTAENIDSGRISQVISILLDNAVSYTPAGGHIRLSLYDEGKHHIIKVSDSGCGIPDGKKKKVFERFYRADDSRTEKDHFGLGLCIAKELTELHHGDISVTDNDGGGSVFTVRLPK